MEYLDYYDESGNYLGYATRERVHKEGLWHKIVHNWMYTKDGKILFQLREGKLYTTASGHVDKGETLEEGAKREIKEEIGIDIQDDDLTFSEVVIWKMDKVKNDGSLFKDRAWSTRFYVLYSGDFTDFVFDPAEVSGIVAVAAREVLQFFEGDIEILKGIRVDLDGKISEVNLGLADFYVNEGETPQSKYTNIVQKLIEERLENIS
ncbi:MAG: NUDIX domain-containing protein [Bacilli bacterium]|nr:NUDIX domain-containing protein [Bacilli bacterium]